MKDIHNLGYYLPFWGLYQCIRNRHTFDSEFGVVCFMLLQLPAILLFTILYCILGWFDINLEGLIEADD